MLPRVARAAAPRDAPTSGRSTIDAGRIEFLPPGQFNMLYAFGVGEVPISISGDPADARSLIHTIRAVGARVGGADAAEARRCARRARPFGIGWPVDEARGATWSSSPAGSASRRLRPALYRLLAERDRYGRLVLLYGARSPDDILFRRELEALAPPARHRDRGDGRPRRRPTGAATSASSPR